MLLLDINMRKVLLLDLSVQNWAAPTFLSLEVCRVLSDYKINCDDFNNFFSKSNKRTN